jgi:hypothetical protein
VTTPITEQEFDDLIHCFALCVRLLTDKVREVGVNEKEKERINYCLKLIEPLIKKYA